MEVIEAVPLGICHRSIATVAHSLVCAVFPWFESINQYIDTTAVPLGLAVPDVTYILSLMWLSIIEAVPIGDVTLHRLMWLKPAAGNCILVV